MSGFFWTAPAMCAAYAATGHAGRHMVKIFFFFIEFVGLVQIFRRRSKFQCYSILRYQFIKLLSNLFKLKLLMFKAKSYKITDVRCGDKFGGLEQRERATCIAHRYVCSLSIIIGYIIYYWLHHSLLATRSQSSAS